MQTNVVLDTLTTGLPSPLTVSVDTNNVPTLQLGEGIITEENPETRYAADLTTILYDPASASTNDPIYTVYRGVTPDAVAEEIDRRGLCYLLTVLRAGTIGNGAEWVRTRGHSNSKAPGTNLPYPEIYEIVQGAAWLYLQHESGDRPTETVVMPLQAGNKAVVAPGWAALLANIGSEPLVLGTWRMEDCHTESTDLASRGGMAHFLLRGESGEPFYKANPKYAAVPEPRVCHPKEMPDFGLTRDEPLLAAFHRSPDTLRCLLRPQDFEDVWKNLYEASGTS